MLKNLNLLGMYVSDLAKSVAFYKQLGFEPERSETDGRGAAYVKLGDFRLQFIAKESAKDKAESFQKDAFGEPKGTGLYVNVQVTDIDQLYESLKNNGIDPSSRPRNWPWGNREFVVRDPDGYKLVMYQRLP